LFDSSRDATQSTDVSAANPDVVAQVERLWRSEVVRWVGLPLMKVPAEMCRAWYHFDSDTLPPAGE
jgi:hypothetical protein